MWFSRTSKQDRLGPLGVVCALVITALCACDTGFVDPTPPELVLLTRSQELKLQNEPVVYGLVLDLDFPDGQECVRTRERLIASAQTAFAAADRASFQLTLQDLSPGCQQTSTRRFD